MNGSFFRCRCFGQESLSGIFLWREITRADGFNVLLFLAMIIGTLTQVDRVDSKHQEWNVRGLVACVFESATAKSLLPDALVSSSQDGHRPALHHT